MHVHETPMNTGKLRPQTCRGVQMHNEKNLLALNSEVESSVVRPQCSAQHHGSHKMNQAAIEGLAEQADGSLQPGSMLSHRMQSDLAMIQPAPSRFML